MKLGKISIHLQQEDQHKIGMILKKHRKVRVLGLGTFELRRLKAKKFHHNFSGKEIKIPAHDKIRFTPVGEFKKAVLK